VIPEIDIWRAATLMLRRYGDKAEEQSAPRVDDLTTEGDHDGAATWRRIADAVRREGRVHGSITVRPQPVNPPISRVAMLAPADELEGRLRALIEEVRFAADSLLEGAGFEPSVPLAARGR
jgi:hypothetical protein